MPPRSVWKPPIAASGLTASVGRGRLEIVAGLLDWATIPVAFSDDHGRPRAMVPVILLLPQDALRPTRILLAQEPVVFSRIIR